MIFKINFAFLFCILISICSYAQLSPEFNTYKNQYPNANKVRLNSETTVTIELINDEIKIRLNHSEEDLYLSETAGFYSEDEVSYSTFIELKDIKASSFEYGGKKYKEVKVKDFHVKDDLSGSAFHDDRKTISFVYSKLKKGSKSSLSYSEQINDPRFLTTYFVGYFFPIIHTKYTIIADKNISLNFKKFNTDDVGLKYSETEKNGRITYTFSAKNIDEYESEENCINFRNTIAHIIPHITGYTVNGKETKLLNDVNGLYGWYYDLIKDVNSVETDIELVKIVNNLLKDKETELDKVKAIYYWVQKNIKYVAYEYALGGFIPREANDIFSKKYGDCKDNSSIMQEMFEIANIKGNLTWIGTRDIPYTYEQVPTPAVDNHMILTYFKDTTAYFLDATGRFHPLGLPSNFIQGKEALISIDSSNYVIRKVPIIRAEQNSFIDETHLSINGSKLTGKGNVKLNGYPKIDYYHALERRNSAKDIKSFYIASLEKGSNKFLISDFTESNKYDYENAFEVDYTFQIDDYITSTKDEIYVNLNLNKELIFYKINKEHLLDKEYEFKNYNKFTNVLNIPEGYRIEYLPENINIKNDLYRAQINYTKKDNQLIYEHTVTLDFLVLKKNEHEAFNDFIDKLDKAYKETIVIKKNDKN